MDFNDPKLLNLYDCFTVRTYKYTELVQSRFKDNDIKKEKKTKTIQLALEEKKKKVMRLLLLFPDNKDIIKLNCIYMHDAE